MPSATVQLSRSFLGWIPLICCAELLLGMLGVHPELQMVRDWHLVEWGCCWVLTSCGNGKTNHYRFTGRNPTIGLRQLCLSRLPHIHERAATKPVLYLGVQPRLVVEVGDTNTMNALKCRTLTTCNNAIDWALL